MRLSGIKLAGFKSFVDPTSLPLPSRLTSVVGPNGCGKSNLIDAVRWVLGEASIKNLRGADSEDVIFNGSRSRKPAGRASVELTFDNSDFQVTGPFAAYAELAVKRELTRDGGSQYYLNGTKCLKRDVTDLFLGTGLGGKNQYAIIEQGMVSRMVEAKPEELRQLLEEAAGISKYKERRRETESRIKQTRENLSRLNDLQGELRARLEVLAKQAANAEKYKQFKEEERQLKAEVLLLRLRALEAQGASQEAAITALEEALEEARAAVTGAEAARDAADARLREAGHLLGAEQAQVFETESTLARHEQNLAHARELKNLRVRELEQLEAQLFELTRRRDQEQLRHQSLTQAAAAAQARASEAEAHEQEQQEALATAEAQVAEQQSRWEEFSQRSQAPMLAAEGERVRVQSQERGLQQLEERLRRTTGERAALDSAPIRDSLNEVDIELATLDEELAEAQSRLQDADAELQAAREQRNAVEAGLHEARQALQSARGRQASLETLQQAALREDDAELGNWLRGNGWASLPRLNAALQVDAGWEAAVEHVLSGLLQAPLLPEWLSAQTPAGPKSGATLLHAEPGSVGRDGTLAARVSGPAAVIDWLSGVHAAASADDAARIAMSLPAGESVITADGVWRGRAWIRYPKLDPQHSGVIARGLLLKQLKASVEELTIKVRDGEQRLTEMNTRRVQLDNERRAVVARFDQTRSRHGQRLAHRQAQAVRLEQTENRIRSLSQELEALAAQRQQQAEELEEARARLGDLEDSAERLRQERAERSRLLAASRDALNQARAAQVQASQQRNQAQIHVASQNSALAAANQALHSLAEQREALVEGLESRRVAGEELDAPIVAKTAEVEAARAAVGAARERLNGARGQLTAAEAAQQEQVRALRAAETRKEAAQERLQSARLEFENLRARREVADSQFAETGFSREELAEYLTPDANGNLPIELWEEKLAAIGRRIDRLGAINLAAIQELEEGRERAAYIDTQHADVSAALTTLEDAMAQLDRETTDRFKTTFDQVNDIFKARFPQLFGGGEAYLELTGDAPDGETATVLNRGVKVMARPPGKRNSTIQLLSGGEKAMTAVALLLALFQLNPAPFCLMDEVDAPLDDANVGRFCEVVREMSQGVQFIIITHNKITMELAEHLHGVTMQEPGVSRLVSVDVQQAVAMVGTPEEAAAEQAN
ncbi:MAG: chromosome segregation protein SMC [Gammaproteobacteria bacterium]|nr:chromosome segregation protein SMC [Gammaproteobacteria bacterium]